MNEGYVINFAWDKVNNMRKPAPKEAENFTGFPKNCSKVIYEYTTEGTRFVNQSTEEVDSGSFLGFVSVYFHIHRHDHYSGHNLVSLYSEYVRDGVLFRGHPDYRGNGGWNDWVMLQYERTPRDNKQNKNDARNARLAFGNDVENYDDFYYCPAKIFGFMNENGTIKAFVKVLDESSCKSLSVLSVSWQNTRGNYIVVPVDAFVGHCLIVPRNEHRDANFMKGDRWGKDWIQILHPDLWADKFHVDKD